MSDTSQGPGWWRASNGLWYPPQAEPGPTPAPRTPPGVPDTTRAEPRQNVQEPFTPRTAETMEHDRARRQRQQDRHDRNVGKRLPWGWIAVVLLVLAFGGVGIWLAVTAGGDDEPAASDTTVAAETTDSTAASGTTSEEVSVFDLAVGDCFTAAPSDDGSGPLVTTAQIVDCTEPHLAEVILVTDLPDADGEPFPGIEARDEAAEDLCQPAFDDYVGIPLAASELGLLWLAPTEESWTDQDDREVACAVQALDEEPLTGSVEGSER